MLKSFTKKKSSKPSKENLDVALIGCGPAGMCLMQALSKRKQNPEAKKSSKYHLLREGIFTGWSMERCSYR